MKKILVLAVVVTVVLTSCSTRGGYGCHGNYSWDRMIWKNTRP